MKRNNTGAMKELRRRSELVILVIGYGPAISGQWGKWTSFHLLVAEQL